MDESTVKCNMCEKKFSKKYSLKRHLLNIHKVPSSGKEPKPISLTFQSMADFEGWKLQIEEQTLSSYISRSINKAKNEYRYYRCHRSGTYVPKGKGQRCLKSQKSAKIGQKCPSRIQLKITESEYRVKYYKDHEGHGKDLEHLRLPTSFRAAVAEKLKTGASVKTVLEEVRNQAIADNPSGRASLLTRKDLHNIKRDFAVEPHSQTLDYVNVEYSEFDDLIDSEIYYIEQKVEEEQSEILQTDDFPSVIPTSTESSCKDREILKTIQHNQKTGTRRQKKKASKTLKEKTLEFVEALDESHLTEKDEEKLINHLDTMLTICVNSHLSRNARKRERSEKMKAKAQTTSLSLQDRYNRKNKAAMANFRRVLAKQRLLKNSQLVHVHSEFDHVY